MSARPRLALVKPITGDSRMRPSRKIQELARALLIEVVRLKELPLTFEDEQAVARWEQQLREMAGHLQRGADVREGAWLELLRAFGKKLRDRRNAAGLSRVALGRKAKLSDATIKFIETAKYAMSRSTFLRLLNVEELGLCWEDGRPIVGGGVPDVAEALALVAQTSVCGTLPGIDRWWDILGVEPGASLAQIDANFGALSELAGDDPERAQILLAAREAGRKACKP